ncbi:MAG: LLM class flavin-dependent oxidoreductase [Nitrososphaerota archaeon]|nr:LLM class flavin-dependent oxidoreductase [Nitrososphaerota archaeon]
MTARLALGFNPVLPVRDAVRISQKAEALGYESVWFHESLYQRDVFTYLTSVLLSTSRIVAGSGAMNTFTRHPLTAAATFASLSELSGGRVRMGLGLGSFPTIPNIGYRIFPVSETRPLRRMKEYVEVLKSFWSGEKLSFKGEFFTAENLRSDFKPGHVVPLYIASLSPMMQSYAGSNSDGAILSPALATTETTSTMVGNVRRGETQGKKAVDKVSYLLTSVDEDGKRARDVIRNFYFFLYQLSDVIKPGVLEPYGVRTEELDRFRAAWRSGSPDASSLVPAAAIDALAVAGNPREAEARIEEYRRVGVDLPALMPIGNVNYAIESLAPS